MKDLCFVCGARAVSYVGKNNLNVTVTACEDCGTRTSLYHLSGEFSVWMMDGRVSHAPPYAMMVTPGTEE